MQSISKIDLLYLTKIVMLSDSEIKNILITYMLSDEGTTDMYLVKKLENAASIIYSEQSIRLYDYIINKADDQKIKNDMSEDQADYLKYRFKQYLGSVSREIQNRKLKETEIDDFSPEGCERFVINKLNELPPVTPQEPRWIPVSEKLPDDRDWYLGIFKEPDTGWINPLPFICDYVGRETKATTKEYWILRGFTDRDYKECDYYYNLECVAWMPLPESYSEVEK